MTPLRSRPGPLFSFPHHDVEQLCIHNLPSALKLPVMSYQVSRVFKSSSSSSSSSSFLLRLRVPLIHYRRTPVYQTTFPRTQSCRRLHCFPSYRTYHNRSRPFLSPKSPENAGTEAGTGTGNAGNDNYLATLSSLDIPTGAKVMTVGQGVKYVSPFFFWFPVFLLFFLLYLDVCRNSP